MDACTYCKRTLCISIAFCAVLLTGCSAKPADADVNGAMSEKQKAIVREHKQRDSQ